MALLESIAAALSVVATLLFCWFGFRCCRHPPSGPCGSLFFPPEAVSAFPTAAADAAPIAVIVAPDDHLPPSLCGVPPPTRASPPPPPYVTRRAKRGPKPSRREARPSADHAPNPLPPPLPITPKTLPPTHPLLCEHYPPAELIKPWWRRAGYSGREPFPLDCVALGQESSAAHSPHTSWRFSDGALRARCSTSGIPLSTLERTFFPRLSGSASHHHREWAGSERATDSARGLLMRAARARCWRALEDDASGGGVQAAFAALVSAAPLSAASPPQVLRSWRVDVWGCVIAREAGNAALCGWDVDHAFPFSRGGLSIGGNLRAMQYASNRWGKRDAICVDASAARGITPHDFVALASALHVRTAGVAALGGGGGAPQPPRQVQPTLLSHFASNKGALSDASCVWRELHYLLCTSTQRQQQPRGALRRTSGGGGLNEWRSFRDGQLRLHLRPRRSSSTLSSGRLFQQGGRGGEEDDSRGGGEGGVVAAWLRIIGVIESRLEKLARLKQQRQAQLKGGAAQSEGPAAVAMVLVSPPRTRAALAAVDENDVDRVCGSGSDRVVKGLKAGVAIA